MLIRYLRDAQRADGHLTPEALRLIALRAGVPIYQVQEVASFFPTFRFVPLEKPVLHVCQSMVCHLKWVRDGGPDVRGWCAAVGRNGRAEVCGVSCLGRCDRAPVAVLERPDGHEELSCRLTPEALDAYLGGRGELPRASDRDPPSARRIEPAGWRINYAGFDPPCYEAVRRYEDTDAWRNDLLGRVERAKLTGMGGAAADAAKKWREVWLDGRESAGPGRAPRDRTKYVVCNADESEPGTFKDRELLLRFPELVIEGVLLAALVLDAHRAFIYVRHEYGEQVAALEDELRAIRAGRRDGPGPGRVRAAEAAHPIEVVVSPGRYICGEETALLEAIEGRRAQPRNNPLNLIREQGLFGHPTVVNNAETFAWVPALALAAAPPPPRRFFSVSGDVETPGVFEVPLTHTLRDLLSAAGGHPDYLLAVAPSGPSGGLLPAEFTREQFAKLRDRALAAPPRPGAEHVRVFFGPERAGPVSVLDFPLDVQVFRAAGLSLGAGVVFYAGTGDVRSHTLNCLEFFRDESCGKCVPCRLGTEQLVELGRLGGPLGGEEKRFARELAATMKAASICGLGRTAPTPLDNYLRYFSPPAPGGS
jgi:NADH:ubiquinone oxidoreductase subunit F (NADH-binding)/NADH:ubiquinone oxidoreductase subunit E